MIALKYWLPHRDIEANVHDQVFHDGCLSECKAALLLAVLLVIIKLSFPAMLL